VAAHLHDPSTLGSVDRIDVVAISRDARVGSVNGFLQSDAVTSEVSLVDREDVERVAALWRSLPAGEQARCHTPPFGLRFWLADRKVLQASICWDCNNVYGYVGTLPIYFPFDAKAPVSVSLLMQCRHVFRAGAA
jgi:hypothetical protein